MWRIILWFCRIIEGYLKWLWDALTGSGSRDSLKRLAICRRCPLNKKGICTGCGCVIKAKVRVDFMLDDEGKSIDGCPEKKW